jgi:hypothetical protein
VTVIELAVFAVFAALFIGVMIYDRLTPAKPMTRETAQRGFVPGASARWIGAAVLSVVMVILGLMELANPFLASETGRGRALGLLRDVFGQYAVVVIFLAMGVAAGLLAYRLWQERTQSS